MKSTDNECCVACLNKKCLLCHPETLTCNAKSILIGLNGQCSMFIPKSVGKPGCGEYPLFTYDEMREQERRGNK